MTHKDNVVSDGFKAYTVKLKASANAVNIRAGAGILYKKKGVIDKRVEFTIVEEKNGWGRLKSGEGWVSLKYFDKVREV